MFNFRKKSNKIDFQELYKSVEDSVIDLPPVKRRIKRRIFFGFLKYAFYLLAALFIVVVLALLININNFRIAFNQALSGKDALEKAVSLIINKDFSQAIDSSLEAEDSFQEAYDKLSKIKNNPIVANTPAVRRQIEDLEYLMNTVEILSKATTKGAQVGQEVERVLAGKVGNSFADFNMEERRRLLQFLFESGPELNGIKANLELSLINIKKINPYGILWPLKSKIGELESQLTEATRLMDKSIYLSEIMPALAGYPKQADYLILFQNQDELRPTGGFIGSYGILQTLNGEIMSLDTHDIYHIDIPVLNYLKVEPPKPIKEYLVDKWYMRDANWSPDWPTSAKKVQWFFEKEDSIIKNLTGLSQHEGEFNGIIGITPEFVTSLLELVGPIEVDGETYTKDNFTELVQYKVEIEFYDEGVSNWDRKQLIARILEKLKDKLYELPSSKWIELVKVINKNIDEKNVLLYFSHPRLEDLALSLGAGGEVKQREGDYLMVVDANLAAFKTDSVMNKGITYSLEQTNDGLLAKLRINYAHSGGYDWRTTDYRTYTRVYVPKGSQLIKSGGISSGKVEVSDELGKTVFGGFIKIKPGSIGSLEFEYLLPTNVSDRLKTGNYDLYVQKQPGNRVGELKVDLKLDNDIKSYNPTGFYIERQEDRNIVWKTDLSSDRNFNLTLD